MTLLPPLPKPAGERVPPAPAPYPALAAGFQLSPTSNYTAPYGQVSLGEALRARVRLHNVSGEAVNGAKMMMEVQSPGGRVRLGEVVHGGARPEGMDPSQAETRAWDELPALEPGGGVELSGEHEINELGLHILICSVAWETAAGRRTFQRFLKFTVSCISGWPAMDSGEGWRCATSTRCGQLSGTRNRARADTRPRSRSRSRRASSRRPRPTRRSTRSAEATCTSRC